MKKYIVTKGICFILLIFAVTFYSCKKGPGDGGRASIKGKVYTINYNSSFTVPQDSGYLGAQKVYLIYGDEIAVGDDQDSNNEGAYEFKYLRKGSYKVFVYTKTLANHIDSAIVQEVEITDSKQTIELPDFRIKTSKN
ncbi:MAG: hypothetical protein HY951_10155 [Bacteroidia bacterium]|nr:hypothetical protein [Bacteroidia bacterium]